MLKDWLGGQVVGIAVAAGTAAEYGSAVSGLVGMCLWGVCWHEHAGRQAAQVWLW